MKFNLKKWIEVIKSVGPFVLAAVPGGAAVAPFVPMILHGIEEAEQIAGATGPEKKAHVIEIVNTATAAANAAGAQLNPALVNAAASDGIDAVLGTVKIIEGHKVAK